MKLGLQINDFRWSGARFGATLAGIAHTAEDCGFYLRLISMVTEAHFRKPGVLAKTVTPWMCSPAAAPGRPRFRFGGVLLGMAALAVGADPCTELNAVYRRVMLVALAAAEPRDADDGSCPWDKLAVS